MPYTPDHLRVRRTLALSASGALLLGTVVVTGPPGTAAAPAEATKESYGYKCKIRAGGFSVNPAKVKVTVRAKLPGSVKAGSKIGKRPIRVTLRLPEEVRLNAVDILKARKAKGKAIKPNVGVKINKKHYQVPVKSLNAKKARIPRKNGAAWRMRAKGTVSAFKVPKSAHGKAKVSVPKRLRVKAKLYRRNGSKINASMKCRAPKDRGFGTVEITH